MPIELQISTRFVKVRQRFTQSFRQFFCLSHIYYFLSAALIKAKLYLLAFVPCQVYTSQDLI